MQYGGHSCLLNYVGNSYISYTHVLQLYWMNVLRQPFGCLSLLGVFQLSNILKLLDMQ